MVETALGQLDKPGNAAQLVGKLSGTSRRPMMAWGTHSFHGSPFLCKRRAGRGAVTGTTDVGWQSQLLHAAEWGEAEREKARPQDSAVLSEERAEAL